MVANGVEAAAICRWVAREERIEAEVAEESAAAEDDGLGGGEGGDYGG